MSANAFAMALGLEAPEPRKAAIPAWLLRRAMFSPVSRQVSEAIPPREWHVPDLLPASGVTLLGGDGGTGKSLLAMQLAISTASGCPWIGHEVRQGGALYLSAEDEEDELLRRIAEVSAAEAIAPLEFEAALAIRSMVGQDALLAALDRATGRLEPTALFRTLDEQMGAAKPALVVLDTLADLHAGDENVRSHARQFITMLCDLAVRHRCAILLLAHPSVAGMMRGSGLSGSTAWQNSVRSRLYLERIVGRDRTESDPNARRLTVKKMNYGPPGREFELVWWDGRFMATGGESPPANWPSQSAPRPCS